MPLRAMVEAIATQAFAYFSERRKGEVRRTVLSGSPTLDDAPDSNSGPLGLARANALADSSLIHRLVFSCSLHMDHEPTPRCLLTSPPTPRATTLFRSAVV